MLLRHSRRFAVIAQTAIATPARRIRHLRAAQQPDSFVGLARPRRACEALWVPECRTLGVESRRRRLGIDLDKSLGQRCSRQSITTG
jgi:hypothetical protein